MGTIAVGQIEPGMMLASDLKDRNGRFLLSKGVELSTKHLKVIKTWGVVEADIEGLTAKDVDEKQTAHIDPNILEAAKKIEQHRFIHNDLENEAIQYLFNICVLRRARKLDAIKNTTNIENLIPKFSGIRRPSSEENTAPGPDPKDLLKRTIKLPSLPTIFNKINEAINDPRCSATQIAGIISKDASLAARLLRIVNSAFYSFPSKIDTISRAVAIIGTKQLSTLSLGTCALVIFKDVPSDLIDMKSFWKHSIACGVIARILSSYKKGIITERFFLGGLLHDIGKLIQFTCIPDLSRNALRAAKETGTLLYEAEEAHMGFNHTRIGGMLMKAWKLPTVLETAVRDHHNDRQGPVRLDTAVIHVADLITNALEIGSSGERLVPPLYSKAWEELKLTTGIFDATIEQAEHQIQETTQIFLKNENQ
jgi:HD-like signal output (HDOD) protein